MKLRATKSWRTRRGKRRYIRLYGSWRNVLARTRGTGKAGNGANYWAGKEVAWATFEEFREWAIGAGYCKELCSLDRRNPLVGYTPRNCRWVTVAANTEWQNACASWAPGDPENFPDCPF